MTKNKYVEDACHDKKRRKCSQTSNTSLMHDLIDHEIGLDGTSEICSKIMQGLYDAPPDTYNTPMPT